MKTFLLPALWLASTLPFVLCDLVGYHNRPYEPPCAHACNRALSGLMLACSSHEESHGGHSHGGSGMTTPACRAGDTPWLTTLAWCMRTKCEELAIPLSQLEAFWEAQATGDPETAAKWSYEMALHAVDQPPTWELAPEDETLNATAVVSPSGYEAQYNSLTMVYREVVLESAYGIALLVTGFGTPIILTWLGYLPYASRLLDVVKPYVVYPSAIGTYQVRALPYLLGNAPTIGHTLYIAMFVVLNIILTAVNYQSRQPHAWFANEWQEIMAYVFYRTGVFAFVLAPLTILFSGRNNILLWLTNWSHSTYMLLHRWVARLFALHVILHSILGLMLYRDTGRYPADESQPYWIWGAVATVAVTIMVVASGLYVRRFVYEFFLISHVVLAVFVIVGSWYHVELLFESQWGYETWLYAACAVWFFDRLARVGRVLKNGMRRSVVTDLGGGYLRVDVPGIRWASEPGKHVYAYFPTLRPLRPWENHPFSVLPTTLLLASPPPRSPTTTTTGSDHAGPAAELDVEKHDSFTTQTAVSNRRPTSGLTLFIKKSSGVTQFLQAHTSLLTLLDGPYPNNPTKEVLRCDRLVLIGGGIGITSLLPWVAAHFNVKLAWSVKASAECLVEAVDGVVSSLRDKDIRIGRRLDVGELLAQEAEAGWARVGVVVSGPGGLCDDVRAAVVAAGKKHRGATVFELEVDAYSW